MSFELQVQSSVLGTIAARAVQARLFTTCFAPFGSVYIDHVDVADTPVAIIPGNEMVRLRVPVDVFVVRRNDVLAAPNRVPVGATTPAGTAIVVLEMAAIGSIVSLRCVDADLGMVGLTLGTSAPAAKLALIQAVGSPITVNLTVAHKKLFLPAPRSACVELVKNVVSIRFESTSPAAVHLFPGEEWGMFLDGASVEQLAKSSMLDELPAKFAPSTMNGNWQPSATIPRVDIDYSASIPAGPDSFSTNAGGKFECEFSLAPRAMRSLRSTVRWSRSIDSSDVGRKTMDDLTKEAVLSSIESQIFGGGSVGDRAFIIDTTLPEVSFGGARFGYAGIQASPAGMTIGGPVKLPFDPGRKTLQPSVTPFGQPFRLEFCSILAHPGGGESAPNVPLADATTHAQVWLENLGAFGDVEIISPGNWIAPYLECPAASPEIRLAIPSVVAVKISTPVRFIVRTARGVRFIDLGTPPRTMVDADGNVTNAVVEFVDDCRYVSAGPEDALGIDWGSGADRDEEPLEPAMKRSDWAGYLSRQRGIDVQLVTLFALEANEVIQFRSIDHAVDITADHTGRAVVPVLLPIGDRRQRASLVRANRRCIAGHFSIRTAVLMNQSALRGSAQNRFIARSAILFTRPPSSKPTSICAGTGNAERPSRWNERRARNNCHRTGRTGSRWKVCRPHWCWPEKRPVNPPAKVV